MIFLFLIVSLFINVVLFLEFLDRKEKKNFDLAFEFMKLKKREENERERKKRTSIYP